MKIKEKILNFLIILIVVALYVAVFMFIYSNFRERKRQELAGGIIDKIDKVINNYMYYNCNSELGNYCSFYIKN